MPNTQLTAYLKAYMPEKLKLKLKKYAAKQGVPMYQVVQDAVKKHIS